MFTGIVQAVGRIASVEDLGGDLQWRVDTGDLNLDGLQIGDSIAVSGVCLTAVDFDAHSFVTDLSAETLSATTLGNLGVADPVNLERSLTLADSLGGHLVTGHVDGIGRILAMKSAARSTRIDIGIAAELLRYTARKGSITVDGTSLTVNEVGDDGFSVNIVPHTLERTIMGRYGVDDRVNIEVDLIARYVERLMNTA